jgi:HEAT repeat protein
MLLTGSLPAAELSTTFKAVAEYDSGADMTPLRQVEHWVNESVRSASLRRQLEAELAKLLVPGTTFEAKRFACQQLAVVGDRSAVPPLSELLADTNTVGIACYALALIPSKQATEALIDALAQAPGQAKVQIIHALGNRKSEAAVRPLIAQTYAADQAIVNAAIVALGKIGGKKSAKAVADLREQNRPPCTAAVLEASLRIAEQWAAKGSRKKARALFSSLVAPGNPLSVRQGAMGGLFGLDADGGEARALEVLRSPDAALKPAAIAHVPSLESVEVSAVFARELPRLPPQEQVLLLEALAIRGDAGALAAATESLKATNGTVRIAAVMALGRLGDAATVPSLAEALTGAEDALERGAIEQSFVQLGGGPETDRALIARLDQRTQGFKGVLIAALAKRNSREAVPVLMAQATRGDSTVAKAAFQGLGRMAGPEDAPSLLLALTQLSNEDVRGAAEDAAGQALGLVPDAARRFALVADLLKRPGSVEGRCSLIGLLPICGDAQALVVAHEAQADADGRVVNAGLRALADWPNSAAWDPLLGAYQQTENEAHRALAFRGLTRLASEDNARVDAKLIERYRTLLRSAKSDGDRKLVLGALAGAASSAALGLAVEQLANTGVRAEAELAVKKIAEAIQDKDPQAAQDALNKLK